MGTFNRTQLITYSNFPDHSEVPFDQLVTNYRFTWHMNFRGQTPFWEEYLRTYQGEQNIFATYHGIDSTLYNVTYNRDVVKDVLVENEKVSDKKFLNNSREFYVVDKLSGAVLDSNVDQAIGTTWWIWVNLTDIVVGEKVSFPFWLSNTTVVDETSMFILGQHFSCLVLRGETYFEARGGALVQPWANIWERETVQTKVIYNLYYDKHRGILLKFEGQGDFMADRFDFFTDVPWLFLGMSIGSGSISFFVAVGIVLALERRLERAVSSLVYLIVGGGLMSFVLQAPQLLFGFGLGFVLGLLFCLRHG